MQDDRAADDPFGLAIAHSRHVARLADAGLTDRESFNALAGEAVSRAHMRSLLDGGPAAVGVGAGGTGSSNPGSPLASRLRRLRSQCLLALIGRDLAGRADLAEVTSTMTALAEECLDAACAAVAAELEATYGEPVGESSGKAQPLLVVGMGKLGGAELNVSSDIDLVFVYPEEGETRGPRSISNHEYFVRLGRKVIALLNDATAEGFVFRVDMRLRPYGDSGPLACSLAMLEEYFITQGREWERYAWIKGRIVGRTHSVHDTSGGAVIPAGHDADAHGISLADTVQPFVFRRHLDFSAIASMRELSEQIRREVRRRDMLDNIKLGAGGIRQVEFVAQVFQLIRGGRDAALRTRPTLDVLQVLGARDLLTPEVVDTLSTSYCFLRRLEHRLQYLDDAQTHALPTGAEDRQRISRSMGFDDWPTFSAALETLRASVSTIFEEVFSIVPGVEDDHRLAALWDDALQQEDAASALAQLGFLQPQRLATRLAELRSGTRVRRMAASGASLLARLMPRALGAAARTPDPDVAIERLLDIVMSIGRRESYLALLLEYPPVLDRLGGLAAASPWASDYLARHPILLDELLDSRTLHAAPEWPRLLGELRAHLDAAVGNVEAQLDSLRHFKHAQLFRIVVQDLAGDLPLEVVSDRLSELADVVLGEALSRCWKHLNLDRPGLAAPRFAIIGYGKLGGKEMGYGSDLDIAYVFDDSAPDAGAQDGGSPERYARLALRLNSWLTTMTSAGVLYPTDLRLRPDGEAGLLAPSITAFEQYQHEKAWPWEHQALTRARFVAGSAALGERFERLRDRILCQPRDIEQLGTDIREMRSRMRGARRTAQAAGTFDIKQGIGGLVDLEFIVQFLVLAHSRAVPALTGNIGNLALLQVAAGHGLVASALAAAAQSAYRELRRLQHALQLAGKDPAQAPAASLQVHSQAIDVLWRSVLGER